MTLDVLKRILAEEFDVDPEEITAETNFYDDLSADSLDMVELALACEEEFGFEIEDNEENWNIMTVGELVDYVESHMEE
ncbi:MAG: acyl carrier protein [Clostridiaceae bacterium]|nr:acyl carrier protein [Clostridiaceae bacterium]MDD6275034.1 acyl carrier protein [Clostridiaceae bacterium]